MHRTLLRYVCAEQAVPFCVSLFVLTLVLFLGKSMRYTQLLFASGSGFADFGKLLLYSLPYFFTFTIPMATLLAVLLAFARLAHDNEITAMKAAGISFYQMIPPVALVAGSAWLFTLVVSCFVLPDGNSALKGALVEMARSRAELGLKERVFNDQFDGLVFFVNEISADGRELKEVFISDERSTKTKSTIIAEKGLFINEPDRNRLSLRLFQGTIIRVGDALRSSQSIRFEKYDFHVDLESIGFGGKKYHKDESHFSLTELRKALAEAEPSSEEHNELLLEWHRRLSLPFACLVLGFVAAPLGVQSGSVSRFSGVVLGLLLFLLYYIFFSAAKALGENGACPPAIGLWLPNVLLGVLAIVLWTKTARESPWKPVVLGQHLVKAAAARLKIRGRYGARRK
ncbi:MAG: LPS export ABC transporter permease LptF [Syntrophobacteria bacterium]